MAIKQVANEEIIEMNDERKLIKVKLSESPPYVSNEELRQCYEEKSSK